MTVYWLSGSLASLVGFILGGYLNEHFGWRITFLLMGMPGLGAALLVKTTIREPRTYLRTAGSAGPRVPRMAAVLVTLWRQRSSRHLGIALILLYTMASGLAPWYAAFMMRSHGMATGELGIWLGLICGLGATAGTLLGGYVAQRWFARSEAAQMRFSAIMVAAVVPCFVLFLLLPGKRQALIALAPLMVVFNVFIGPTFALLQRLVVAEMRATTLAVVMLFANLIGMGVGPQVVGIFSDWLRPLLGIDSLRYAMLAMSFVALWAGHHFWRVGQTVKADLALVETAVHRE
jgi:predicted MFS family arabinose efflux permease